MKKHDNQSKDLEQCECGAVAGEPCNWSVSTNGDEVHCLNCEKESLVVQGCEICPKCGEQGHLVWLVNGQPRFVYIADGGV